MLFLSKRRKYIVTDMYLFLSWVLNLSHSGMMKCSDLVSRSVPWVHKFDTHTYTHKIFYAKTCAKLLSEQDRFTSKLK